MGKKMYEREYHRNRLAKNYRDYRFMGSRDFRYGLHRDWAESQIGFGFTVHWKDDDGVRQTKFCPRSDDLIVKHYRRRGFPFEDVTLRFSDITFWQAEEMERYERHLTGKKWTDKGSFIGYGKSKKWLRTKYHIQRRIRERRAIHLIMKDDESWENINLDMDRGAQWWEIF